MEITSRPRNTKPKFARQQSKILKKLSRSGWHAPKGMHSKLRRKRKGKGLLPSIGYSSPRKFRGLTRQGLIQTRVSEVSQLNNLTKKAGIIMSRTLGARKKLELLKKIKESNLVVLNINNIEAYIKKIEEKRKILNELKKKKEEKKKKSKEEAAKKPEEKQKEETLEEKEKREKAEKRKVLEQK